MSFVAGHLTGSWLLLRAVSTSLSKNAILSGVLPAADLLALAWLWAALSQEALGQYSLSLQCYNHAMGVAQADPSAGECPALHLRVPLWLLRLLSTCRRSKPDFTARSSGKDKEV